MNEAEFKRSSGMDRLVEDLQTLIAALGRLDGARFRA